MNQSLYWIALTLPFSYLESGVSFVTSLLPMLKKPRIPLSLNELTTDAEKTQVIYWILKSPIAELKANALAVETTLQQLYQESLDNPLDPYSLAIAYKYSQVLINEQNEVLAKVILDGFLENWKNALDSPTAASSEQFNKVTLAFEDNSISPLRHYKYATGSTPNPNPSEYHLIVQTLLENAFSQPLSPISDRIILSWLHLENFLRLTPHRKLAQRWALYEHLKILDLQKTKLDDELNMDNIHFPIRIRLEANDYIISEELGSGASALTFKGYSMQKPQDTVVIKVLRDKVRFPKRVFRNEILGLRSLKRLIAVDEQHYVIVQTFIPGIPLDVYAYDLPDPKTFLDSIKEQYDSLVTEFHMQTGLAHRDIRPANVIVDSNSRLHVIDFGMVEPLPFDSTGRKYITRLDKAKADYEWNHYIDYLQADKALLTPEDPLSREIVFNYMSQLALGKRETEYANWKQTYKQVFQEDCPESRIQDIRKEIQEAKEKLKGPHMNMQAYKEAYIVYINSLRQAYQYAEALQQEFRYRELFDEAFP